MKRQRFFYCVLLAALFILLMLFPIGSRTGFAYSDQLAESRQTDFICKVPLGEDGIHYEGQDIPEMLVWGPSAFTIAPDGSYWIADTAANRLIQYSPDCHPLSVIELQDWAVGIGDIAASRSELWALDVASLTPAVLKLSYDGKVIERYDLPSDVQPGLSGIAVDNQGSVFIERDGGALMSRLEIDKGQSMVFQEEYSYEGRSYQFFPADLSSQNANRGTIQAGDTRIEIITPNSLGGLRLLGVSIPDTFYVIVDEVALVDGVIQVDQTVRQYRTDGNLLALARVPLSEQYVSVDHGIAIGPDSSVYVFLTRPEGAEIRQLHFLSELPILLHPDTKNDAELFPPADFGPESPNTISPQSIINNARGYINNSKYLSATNTDGACTNRSKPRYIGGAGNYTSVPYDWGGADSVAEFNSFMSPNTYKSGDISPDASQSCSRGVDCSGFVQRAWGLPATPKYGTSTLPNISWQLPSLGKLWRGDILNNTTSHVVLFSNFTPNGVYTYESTTYNNYDRVVYIFRSWSWLSGGGYRPYRYNNVSTDTCSGQYRAEYYNGRIPLANPVFTTCENWPINHDWGSGGPGNGVWNDNFSARWAGKASFSAGNYTFIARSDDGIRVWLDDNLILDKWFDQGPTEYRVTRDVSAGEHTVQVDYYENAGGAVAQFRWEQTGTSCPSISDWKGEYWNNRFLSGNPILCRNDASVNFDWGNGGPGGGVPNDNFSARWTRSLYFSNSGNYRFHVRSDDGVRLWVDGSLVIDKWFDQGATEYTKDLSLNSGTHSFKIEYYENSGGAVAQFWFEQISSGGNLALNRPAYATSQQGTGYEPYRGNDGSTGTRWSSRISSTLGDEWWRVDLGSRTFNSVIIRWEAAYAAQHFVGWSNDGSTYYGYWYNISAPGAYRYNLGTQTSRYAGLLMRSRAPGMNNYSFWEYEVYNNATNANDTEDIQTLNPLGALAEILFSLSGQNNFFLPLIVR